ncbi:ubiquitin-associated protein 1-like isoform X1 [Mya arenaria]|uniref:ubiquitin-associated protein 1-like isoform X1 n=1 Tax=Mya arenaria TaxID=6604 RepID=UPI0022DEE036|nr:ubiquitin-associated protein 1-like isoform X1 [Mya arenaria]
MAYDGGNIYAGGSFSSNCLDDIPFKLGSKFKPPNKVVVPPDLNLFTPSIPKGLNEEYSFEVEEAVLKWSAEKEKQDQIKRDRTIKRQKLKRDGTRSSQQSDDTEQIYANSSQECEQVLYENMGIPQQPIPKPRPSQQTQNYASVVVPNPLIANISSSILTPTCMSNSGSRASTTEIKGYSNQDSTKADQSDFDITWFEKEDNPFDQLERETINDMEELANVLSESSKVSPTETNNRKDIKDTDNVVIDIGDNEAQNDETETSDTEPPLYENVELRMMDLKITNGTKVEDKDQSEVKNVFDVNRLPPVPPRRDLVGRGVLPPIGSNGYEEFKACTDLYSSKVDACLEGEPSDSIEGRALPNGSGAASALPLYENTKSISPKPPVPKPPRTFKYSRHSPISMSNDDFSENTYDNVKEPSVSISQPLQPNNPFSVQFTNTSSPTDAVNTSSSEAELNFVNHHFGAEGAPMVTSQGGSKARPTVPPRPALSQSPPPRPSSAQQAWNRFSPLPPAGSGSEGGVPLHVGLPGLEKTQTQDKYSRLDTEARASVDNLTTMGFSKDRVIRAVDKLGADEKEVVEYLCFVDQLVEKGFNISLAETALLIFNNSINKACTYLELFTQLRELGFNGEKIKEALIKTDNDREKTLDILTASS